MALRQPPAACTAVVEAPRRTSSAASPRRPECDETPSRPSASGQDLQAAVDLVRAERDDALGRGGLLGRAQVLDGADEGTGEQPQVLAPAVGVGLRGPHADPQLPAARRRRDVAPDQGGDLGAAQAGAERQRHDRGVAPAAGCGSRGRLPPPAAALGPPGRPHQVERGRVVQGGGLAGRRRGDGGVLARDAAQRVGDQRRLRRVRPPGRARGGRGRRRRGLHRRQACG